MKFVISFLTILLQAQQAVHLYSAEKERALGNRLASEIRKQSEPLGDPSVQAYVDRIGRQLVSGLKDRRLEYQFEVISGGDRTEPFALPGGYVFIPAHAFLTARDEHEFACVLAHAIAHVALRHGIPDNRDPIKTVAGPPVVFVGGRTGLHADSQAPQALLPTGFLEIQRTREPEADRFGLELAARAGYDGSAFLRYVERTHPADSRNSPLPGRGLRLARIRETVASLQPSAPSASGEDFKSIQERIQPVIEQFQRSRVPSLRQ